MMLKSDWRATSPLIILDTPPFNTNQNFEKVISFIIVKRSSNYASGDVLPPQSWSKDCKLRDFSIIYMQDLLLGKGEIFDSKRF